MSQHDRIIELRKQVQDLEQELARYKRIAAHYRAALGDVRANTILAPFFESEREREKPEGDWRSLFPLPRQSLDTLRKALANKETSKVAAQNAREICEQARQDVARTS